MLSGTSAAVCSCSAQPHPITLAIPPNVFRRYPSRLKPQLRLPPPTAVNFRNSAEQLEQNAALTSAAPCAVAWVCGLLLPVAVHTPAATAAGLEYNAAPPEESVPRTIQVQRDYLEDVLQKALRSRYSAYACMFSHCCGPASLRGSMVHSVSVPFVNDED